MHPLFAIRYSLSAIRYSLFAIRSLSPIPYPLSAIRQPLSAIPYPLTPVGRHLPHVLRPRPDQPVDRVLLDGVADPADGAADREKRQRCALLELQRTRQRDQREVDRRLLAGNRLPRLCRRARERHLDRFREALAEELEQERRAWIAGWVERMAEAVEHLAAAEAVGHRLADVG